MGMGTDAAAHSGNGTLSSEQQSPSYHKRAIRALEMHLLQTGASAISDSGLSSPNIDNDNHSVTSEAGEDVFLDELKTATGRQVSCTQYAIDVQIVQCRISAII